MRVTLILVALVVTFTSLVLATQQEAFTCGTTCQLQRQERQLKQKLFVLKHNLHLYISLHDQQSTTFHSLGLEKAKTPTNVVDKQIKSAQTDINNTQGEIDELKAQISSFNKQLTDVQHKILTSRQTIAASLHAEIEKDSQTIATLKSQSDAAVDKSQLNSAKQSLHKKKVELLDVQNKILTDYTLRVLAHSMHHRNELEKKLAAYEASYTVLNTNLASLLSTNQKSAQVDFEKDYNTKLVQSLSDKMAKTKDMIATVDRIIDNHVKTSLQDLKVAESDETLKKLRELIKDETTDFYSLALKLPESGSSRPHRLLCSLDSQPQATLSGLEAVVSQLFGELTCYQMHPTRINAEYKKNASSIRITTQPKYFSKITAQLQLASHVDFQVKRESRRKVQNGITDYKSYSFAVKFGGDSENLNKGEVKVDQISIPENLREHIKEHPSDAKKELKAYLLQKLNLPVQGFSGLITVAGLTKKTSPPAAKVLGSSDGLDLLVHKKPKEEEHQEEVRKPIDQRKLPDPVAAVEVPKVKAGQDNVEGETRFVFNI